MELSFLTPNITATLFVLLIMLSIYFNASCHCEAQLGAVQCGPKQPRRLHIKRDEVASSFLLAMT